MIIEKENKIILMQERLKEIAFSEINEVFHFADEYYGEYLLEIVDDFTSKAKSKDEIISAMIPHLISWAVLYHRILGGRKTILQYYLDSPEYRSKRRPKVHRILREWKYAMPGFYFVEEIADERILVVSDLFQMKEKLVAVYNELYRKPNEGDMVFGYLLPAGDGTYSPVIDFFHIPATHTRDTAFKVLDYYNKKAVSTDLDFFMKHYPKLLALISQTLSHTE
jgi:hypothetical protein